LGAKREGETELSIKISGGQRIYTMPGSDKKFVFKEIRSGDFLTLSNTRQTRGI